MMILAIDPGTTESAFVLFDEVIRRFGKVKNEQLLEEIAVSPIDAKELTCVIERIESYGMSVGREVFETCFWIGRFMERWRIASCDKLLPILITRREVKLYLCGSNRAKDANVRQALIDRFGGKEKAIGRKASPGPLYGISGDVWSALAVAITFKDQLKGEIPK